MVAGRLRGRRILAPVDGDTRPTTDRVREATCNALDSLGVIDGAVVVDLFAGSGALGIEALSRGAASAIFVERDAAALRALRENLRALDLESVSRVVTGDAIRALTSVSDATLVFADPPYDFDSWAELLALVGSHLPSVQIVVAESDRDLSTATPPFVGWDCVRSRRYGRTHVSFLRRLA